MTFQREMGRLRMIRERKGVFVIGYISRCVAAEGASEEDAK